MKLVRQYYSSTTGSPLSQLQEQARQCRRRRRLYYGLRLVNETEELRIPNFESAKKQPADHTPDCLQEVQGLRRFEPRRQYDRLRSLRQRAAARGARSAQEGVCGMQSAG